MKSEDTEALRRYRGALLLLTDKLIHSFKT